MLFITEVEVLATNPDMKGPSSLYSAPSSGENSISQALPFYGFFFLGTFCMNGLRVFYLYQLVTSVKVRY